MIDFIGYLAPVFVVLSFLFKDLKKLRMVNSVGCVLFVIYGLFIAAYPVVIANGIIVCVNIWQMFFAKKQG
jgi:uncharacterized protein with PQ loop repeat